MSSLHRADGADVRYNPVYGTVHNDNSTNSHSSNTYSTTIPNDNSRNPIGSTNYPRVYPGFMNSAVKTDPLGGHTNPPLYQKSASEQPHNHQTMPEEPADTKLFEELQAKLQQLQDMGFVNTSQNFAALLSTRGDIDLAIQSLLKGSG